MPSLIIACLFTGQVDGIELPGQNPCHCLSIYFRIASPHFRSGLLNGAKSFLIGYWDKRDFLGTVWWNRL
jgi:hypothetical protein